MAIMACHVSRETTTVWVGAPSEGGQSPWTGAAQLHSRSTEGMTCKKLSEKTLVTKGTLTGVLDRLEKKGLIERVPSREDRRCTLIRLTPKGDARFREVFPAHIEYMRPHFQRALTAVEANKLRELLLRLKDSFERT